MRATQNFQRASTASTCWTTPIWQSWRSVSADGSTSALFQVRESEANSAPAKSELIFNKYGNRYFLAELFEEGNATGSQVAESRYEKVVSHEAVEAQEHVPAHRGMQKGK